MKVKAKGLKMASEFRHLTWLEHCKGAKHNLGSSSILTYSLKDIGPLDPQQQVGGANPAGDVDLVEMLSQAYRVEKDRIMVTNGAGEANAHIAMVSVEKGDEVLAERPVYQSLIEVPRFLGARVVHFERRLAEGFGIDLEKFKTKLTRRCRLVILTNLHNPSCAKLDEGTLRGVAELAADAGATVLSDEVYLDCAHPGAPPTMASLGENCLSTNSLSKAYGAGGFRLGWAIGAPGLVKALKRLRDHTSIAPNRLGEEAAKSLFRRREEVLARTRYITRRNTSAMDQWVSTRKDVLWFKPTAGTICFPKILKKTSTIHVAQRCFAEESLLVCPGEFFGAAGHFRIGLGGVPELFMPALEALGRVLDRTD